MVVIALSAFIGSKGCSLGLVGNLVFNLASTHRHAWIRLGASSQVVHEWNSHELSLTFSLGEKVQLHRQYSGSNWRRQYRQGICMKALCVPPAE